FRETRMAENERSPQFYARVAGTIYLVAMALGIYSTMVIMGRLIVPGDVAATSQNLLQQQGLFRIGIVIDVVTFVTDVVIAWAFYQLLKSVDSALASLGAFLRIADAAILAVTTMLGVATVKALSGADYLQAFNDGQINGLARLFVSVRGAGFSVGFVFL